MTKSVSLSRVLLFVAAAVIAHQLLKTFFFSDSMPGNAVTKTIKLRDGTEIPWVGFGTGTAQSRKDCTEVAELALKRGFEHFDTAQAYKNEQYLGQALKGVPRKQIYVTTKLTALDKEKGLTVEDTLRESLTKLQLDYVDLFLIHNPKEHSANGELKNTWRQVLELRQKGLTKSVGVSNFNVKFLKEILADGLEAPAINQIEFHPWVYNGSKELLDFHAQHGIVTESYGGLSPILPNRGDESVVAARKKLVVVLDKLAAARSTPETQVTQNQILLKWLQTVGAVAVTTSSKESRIDEYLAAGDLSTFTEDEIKDFNAAIAGVHFRQFKWFDYMDD